MNIRKVSDTLTEIDGRVRIERGPARRREVATAELLGDATASHYHLPRTRDGVTVHAIDALGKPIVEGEPFDFIDWLGGRSTFYVYLRQDGVWQPAGSHDAEDAAMSAAVTLAGAQED